MQFINPDLLGRFETFKKSFIIPIEKKGEKSKIELLRQMVGPYLLRRTIQTVAKDLPELTQQIVYTEMSELQKKIYIREKNSFKNYLRANSNKSDKQYTINIQTALLRLRQIANHPLLHPDFEDFDFDLSEKFNLICNTIKTLFLSDHKVLVFSQFVGYIRLFERWMTAENIPFLTLTGETPIDNRKNLIDKFQNEQSHPIFLISLKAGGSGLNLTAADYVLLADPWWNPQVEQQAIARSYRIGQDKPVFAQKFIVKDSIEERILKLQEVKKDLANDLLDTSGRLLLDDSDLNFLISD
jgi:non-specific serine/threonine protein kinase